MPESASELNRELGTLEAMMLGLSSIIGTDVFVSLGIGAKCHWKSCPSRDRLCCNSGNVQWY